MLTQCAEFPQEYVIQNATHAQKPLPVQVELRLDSSGHMGCTMIGEEGSVHVHGGTWSK